MNRIHSVFSLFLRRYIGGKEHHFIHGKVKAKGSYLATLTRYTEV